MASRVLTEEEKIAEWEERKREKENAMVPHYLYEYESLDPDTQVTKHAREGIYPGFDTQKS